MREMIESQTTQGADPIDAAMKAIAEAIKRGAPILFEGDAYSHEWHEEAMRRGLIEAVTIPEKIDLFLLPKNKEMLDAFGVFKQRELEALHEIRMESFARTLEIEMSVLYDMLWEGILPGLSKQLILEKDSIAALGAEFSEGEPWRKYIRDLGLYKAGLISDAIALRAIKDKIAPMSISDRATALVEEAVPLMRQIREKCDAAELLMSSEIWPYPIYRNLLSLSC